MNVVAVVVVVVASGVLFERAAALELVVAAGIAAEVDFETALTVAAVAGSATEVESFGLGGLGADHRGTERQARDQSVLGGRQHTFPLWVGFLEKRLGFRGGSPLDSVSYERPKDCYVRAAEFPGLLKNAVKRGSAI